MKVAVRTSDIVKDSQVAKLIVEPLQLRFLTPFIGRERSASEVARELDVPLTTLAYRLEKLLEAGLLRVTRIRKRSGSPVKLYRAVADSFFVPFEVTDADSLESLIKRWEEPWLSMFHHAYAQALAEAGSGWGVRVWRDGTDEIRVVPDLVRPGAWHSDLSHSPVLLDELFLDVRLSHEDAKALRQRLLEVIKTYQGRKGTDRYFLRIMLAPSSANKVLR
jgi:DNA-binding transcriptional ArsR family regulator